VRDKNTALRDFLDVFNHRLISLFYRARERSRPALLFERGPGNPLERTLAAVIGIGTPELGARLGLPDRALYARAGLLGLRPMPAVALAALVRSVFGVPAEVEQFRPARFPLEPGDRSRLGRANCRLGVDLVLGAAVELADAKFRLRLGPLRRAQFEQLLPDRPAFRRVSELVRFATRAELDFDVQLVLAPGEAPPLALCSGRAALGRLGWSAWLGPPPKDIRLGQAVFSSRAGAMPASVTEASR